MNKQLIKHVSSAFEDRFNQKPLLIGSPGRINLIGEHTDYNKGLVFPATIDKHIICALAKSNRTVSGIYALDFDETLDINLKNLEKHESGSWKNYITGIVWGLQERGLQTGNFDIAFSGNIPIGAGLSSSAALENSVVFGLNELFNLGLSKKNMIQISVNAEHKFAGVECGIMDQFVNLHGRAGHALLLDCSDLSFQHIPIQLEDYQLLLINTNVKHRLNDSPYNRRKAECKEGLRILQSENPELKSLSVADLEQLNALREKMSETVYNRCRYVIEENKRVRSVRTAVENKHWQKLGELLFASHEGLRDLYEVSCAELDFIVDMATEHDAVIGSRMMGGGFGGCTLQLIKKDRIQDFISAVNKEYQLKFNRSVSTYPVRISAGTQIIET